MYFFLNDAIFLSMFEKNVNVQTMPLTMDVAHPYLPFKLFSLSKNINSWDEGHTPIICIYVFFRW